MKLVSREKIDPQVEKTASTSNNHKVSGWESEKRVILRGKQLLKGQEDAQTGPCLSHESESRTKNVRRAVPRHPLDKQHSRSMLENIPEKTPKSMTALGSL